MHGVFINRQRGIDKITIILRKNNDVVINRLLIYMYTCIDSQTHIHIQTHTHKNSDILTHTYVYSHIHTYMYIQIQRPDIVARYGDRVLKTGIVRGVEGEEE